MHSQLFRQWQLLKMLSMRRFGVTLKEMSEHAGVDEKTIRRDLKLFRDLGFPLAEEAGDYNRKRWRVAADWSETHKHFTFDEAIALVLARRCLEPLAGTPFWLAANRAFDKIQAAFTDDVVAYLDRMASRFYCTSVGSSDYAAKRDIVDALWIAVEDRRATYITYQSARATEPVSYHVHPYGLAFHNHSLYLIGYSPTHEAVRHWKLDRIANAVVEGPLFRRDVSFDLADHFANSFAVWDGKEHPTVVKIRFSPEAARYVREKRWHASQQLTLQRDGSLLAEFRLTSTVEVKSWVLGFGSDAEVLAPPELRAEVRQELESLLDRYRTDRPAATPAKKYPRSKTQ
ncbi:MAG: WYL domain-containing protein [Planctomycetes bacterium]|nr:WYL domain-containing protein [Planctomycetota bacterium]